MGDANIFIDEYGNTALNTEKAGTFSHFIYCSVVIHSKDREKAEDLRKKIAFDYKLGPNIKSSNIKGKHFDKRLKILSQLKEGLDFTIDVLVIDKARLGDANGLQYKQVFYKYFHNLFVNKYNEKYESFSIWADKVGEKFMFELQDYIRTKSAQPTLFNPDRYYYMSDDVEKEKLIQLADIVCGSVGKIFCTSDLHPRAQEIYDILHTRMSVDYFPYHSSTNESTLRKLNSYDKEIKEINLSIIESQLTKLRQENRNEHARLLEYLLLNFRINPSRLIPTYDITAYLSNFFDNTSDDKTQALVRDLRYNGIFVISHAGKPGYKLANSYWDITQQFEHYLKYVIPMLRKVKILNNSIAERTFNEINILENEKSFQELKQMLTGIK